MKLPELEVSETEKFEAIKQAAENGNVTAMLKLSEFYEKGIGTTVNRDLADYWHNEADVVLHNK